METPFGRMGPPLSIVVEGLHNTITQNTTGQDSHLPLQKEYKLVRWEPQTLCSDYVPNQSARQRNSINDSLSDQDDWDQLLDTILSIVNLIVNCCITITYNYYFFLLQRLFSLCNSQLRGCTLCLGRHYLLAVSYSVQT